MSAEKLVMVGDFETTVYEGQTSTEVWASALVPLFTEDVAIFHSIDETFTYMETLRTSMIVYYHNLKFDGSFWLSYLLRREDYKPALQEYHYEDGKVDYQFDERKDMRKGTYTYCISDKGLWYYITIRTKNGSYIDIRDSLKLLPFSVKALGKSFGTKHKKLEMEYEGERYAGCYITPEEKQYIANDVLVVKEALEVMFSEGHTKLTIGSCCMAEFKQIIGREFATMCPDLTTVDCPIEGFNNADAYIRHSYRGGWCYLVKGKEEIIVHNGVTVDVNSLYPSMMSKDSDNPYPAGLPTWWTGSVPEEAKRKGRYFFVRIRTRFYLKKNRLPTIQIKGNPLYQSNEWLESSDVVDKRTGKKLTHYTLFGEEHDTRQELFLTMTDYKLFHEQYYTEDYEELDGCWFYTVDEFFDQYISKYKKIKMESKGAIRTLAKLYLNNLYGKLASGTDSCFKIVYLKEDGALGFKAVEAYNKKAGYIAMGSAITSYARNFTIRAAQANYYGVNKAGFIYADTDSLHLDIPIEQVKGVTLHPTEFCCWAHECSWDSAIFTRQKTYIEHIIEEDEEPVEVPYNSIKCAGMPQRCKDLLAYTLGDDIDLKKLTEEEEEFIKTKRTLKDFTVGLKVPSKLMVKNIKGGTLLVSSYYEMR